VGYLGAKAVFRLSSKKLPVSGCRGDRVPGIDAGVERAWEINLFLMAVDILLAPL